MNFRCKVRHRRSSRRPRFPIRVQNVSDLATFSVDFCILYADFPPYFYFRFLWPTDLKSIPHASTPTSIIPTRFEVDMTIHCRVIAFLSADKSRDLVTLTFDLLTLNSYHTWRVTWPTLPQRLKTLWLFVHELRVITVPIDCHCKCVRGDCACAESRDPWVGGQNNYIFGIPDPDLPIHYTSSSEQSLTDTIKLADRENPLLRACVWAVLLHKLSYSKFCVENRKFSLPWQQGSVWVKCD